MRHTWCACTRTHRSNRTHTRLHSLLLCVSHTCLAYVTGCACGVLYAASMNVVSSMTYRFTSGVCYHTHTHTHPHMIVSVCCYTSVTSVMLRRHVCRLLGTVQPVRFTSQGKQRQQEMMARGLPQRRSIDGVRQMLVVASGKGGVGKSTTAVNLAVAMKLNEPHKQVGLLDADIFGPSVPLMMNLHGEPLLTLDNKMKPLVNYGVKCMSMGFLVEDSSPVAWRGLMVMGAVNRLLRQVAWGDVDYLLVDTPPGTGDAHLSLIQNVPITGVLLVTTPQLAALQVTRRGAVLYQRLGVPIAGILHNMSTVTCPHCGGTTPLFGDATRALAEQLGIPVLQDIPLDADVTQCTDTGQPVVVARPESPQAAAYKALAHDITVFLSAAANAAASAPPS